MYGFDSFSSAEHGFSVTSATDASLIPVATLASCVVGWRRRAAAPPCGGGVRPRGGAAVGWGRAVVGWWGRRGGGSARRDWQDVVETWHYCHCRLPGGLGMLKCMRISDFARRVAGAVREMNDAVRRMTELRLTRDLGLGNGPPSTYAEFLLRTSATTVHEPSARRRAAASRRASGRTGAGRMQPPAAAQDQGCCCE